MDDIKLKQIISDSLKKYSPLGINHENISIKNVSDGNLNYVLRVQDNDNKDIIVCCKHAPPYIPVLGEDYPLSPIRAEMEWEALSKFDSICPGSVPKPYYFDKELNMLCTEFLEGYEVMRRQLVNGILPDEVVQKAAKYAAALHQETHVSVVDPEEFKQLIEKYKNTELVDITRQYFFERPFTRSDSTNKCLPELEKHLDKVWDNPDIIEGANEMKNIFFNKKECLIHGDLHSGSFMFRDNDLKIIDVEFAYVGPAAMDLGQIIAHYIISYYRHMLEPVDNDQHRKIAYKMEKACRKTVEVYLNHFTRTIGNRDEYVEQLMYEVSMVVACDLIRRTIGVAQVEDLKNRPGAAEEALLCGVRIMQARKRIKNIDRLLFIGLMLC